MLIFILYYLLFCLMYIERKYNYKRFLSLIASSSKTSKNRLIIDKKLKRINKQVKLFLFWPVLSTIDIINEIKRNRS